MSGELDVRDKDELEQARALAIEQPQLVLPFTGELIDLREPAQVAHGLEQVRDAKRRLDQLRQLLETLLRAESHRQGTKTLHLEGLTAVVTGGERAEWDIPLLRERLRAAGLPDERLHDLVVETIEYRVDARVAKQLEAANPAYKQAIEAARTIVPAAWRVSVKP